MRLTTPGVPPSAYDLPFGAASKYAGVDCSTLRRWHCRGVKTVRGRVRLDALRKGGAYSTSRAAIDDFIAACNPVALEASPAEGDTAPPDADRPRALAARHDAAMATLRRMGVYGKAAQAAELAK